MNNQKTVKSANSEKSAVLYIVTCALVVIQPLLDILSSIVINLGRRIISASRVLSGRLSLPL